MVSLAEVRYSNKKIANANTPRVTVIVGGTAGIGKAALMQLASCGFPVKVYIIGRDEPKQQPFVDNLRALNKGAEIIFLEGQISLLAEAKRLSNEILKRESSINLLFLSAGFLPFNGREETAEGLELSLAVAYYSRQVFIRSLLPLLRAASSSEIEPYSPRVVNILGAGAETAKLFLDDLTLKEPGHFNVPNYAIHSSTMTSISLKRLAEEPENRGVVFIHAHPGVVTTDLLRNSMGDKWDPNKPNGGAAISIPPGKYVQSTPQEAGERSLYLITSAKYGGKGVPLQKGQSEALTVKGASDGSLLRISDNLESLQGDEVFEELENTGAADIVWNKTEELIGRYL